MATANAQLINSDFKTISVNKKIREFPDKFDLSSPINSFITFEYTIINGRDSKLWKTSCSLKRSLMPDSTVANSTMPENLKQYYLNAIVTEIKIYRDSVAFVITQMIQENGQTFYSVRNFHSEQGNWVNNGEDLFSEIENAHKFINRRAEPCYEDFQSCQRGLYNF
jgi:hypothetical protein